MRSRETKRDAKWSDVVWRYDLSVASTDAAHSVNTLTIEQLAAKSGMSVRNIRSHQARGLLPPPEVRMRVGFYGPHHVARLKLIHDLQRDGFNLAGIKRLLDDSGATADRLDRFRQAVTEQHTERPETLSLAQLGRLFRVSAAEAESLLERAGRLGILVPDGDGQFIAPNPSLLALAQEAVAGGIALDAVLEAFEEVELHTDAVAAAFVRLFIAQVWSPFERASMPEEGWPALDAALERLRPVASEALEAIFQRRMKAQLDVAFDDITEGLASRG